MKTALATTRSGWNKTVLLAILFVILGLLGFFTIKTLAARQLASTQPVIPVISPAALEEKYGMQVSLIGVTAAGGMVDLRLKILDAEKARQLIEDNKHLPELVVVDNGMALAATEDSQLQELQLENGGNLFLLFPNARNAVKAGSSISIRFTTVSLEPISAK